MKGETETAFKAGDRVWFISKFGNRVTGVYEKADAILGADGLIHGHNVRSDNAFGPDTTTKGLLCFARTIHHEIRR